MPENLVEFLTANYVFIVRWVSYAIFFIGLVYQFVRWGKRNPTSLMVRKIVKTKEVGLRGIITIIDVAIRNILTQLFVAKRSKWRWLLHFTIFLTGGFFVFFHAFLWLPIVDPVERQHAIVDPFKAWARYVVFPVGILGILIAFTRRLYRRCVPEELSSYNLTPLLLMLIILVTGFLAQLTAPFEEVAWDPRKLSVFSIVHIFSAYFALAIFPFTKFFHILLRLLAFPVEVYSKYAEMELKRVCANCGEEFTSEPRMQELVAMVGELSEGWLLRYCPNCRRIINAQLDRAAPSIIRPEPSGSLQP